MASGWRHRGCLFWFLSYGWNCFIQHRRLRTIFVSTFFSITLRLRNVFFCVSQSAETRVYWIPLHHRLINRTNGVWQILISSRGVCKTSLKDRNHGKDMQRRHRQTNTGKGNDVALHRETQADDWQQAEKAWGCATQQEEGRGVCVGLSARTHGRTAANICHLPHFYVSNCFFFGCSQVRGLTEDIAALTANRLPAALASLETFIAESVKALGETVSAPPAAACSVLRVPGRKHWHSAIFFCRMRPRCPLNARGLRHRPRHMWVCAPCSS